MPNPKKPDGMDRREFLQFAGSGLLFSLLDPRTAYAGTAEDATVVSDAFSLGLHFTPGGGAVQISSLRNSKTGFEWARASTPLEPVFAAAGTPSQKWSSSRPAVAHRVDESRFELAAHSEDGRIRSTLALQPVSGNPILEVHSEFHNASKAPLAGVTAFGPLRFALRNDLGPLVVHAVRRNEYALESIPVNGSVKLSGGRWNAPEYGGLLLLEAVGKDEFLLVGIEWERGWRIASKKTPTEHGSASMFPILLTISRQESGCRRLGYFSALSHGDLDQAFVTTRHYMQQNVFPAPLEKAPWVVYDFWATEAEGVEEAALHEVEFAATLGVDVFVMDASWYVDSSKKGTGDWGCGLGNYTDDRVKYPMGLAEHFASCARSGDEVRLVGGTKRC